MPLTRREAVARQLREEILSGQLLPGTLLKDAELAARLGMSITPVREAITQLAAEGLVDISPNRTRKVAGFTLKSALDLVDVMELLACAGFAAGTENLTDDHLARLGALHDRCRDLIVGAERGEWRRSFRVAGDEPHPDPVLGARLGEQQGASVPKVPSGLSAARADAVLRIPRQSSALHEVDDEGALPWPGFGVGDLPESDHEQLAA